MMTLASKTAPGCTSRSSSTSTKSHGATRSPSNGYDDKMEARGSRRRRQVRKRGRYMSVSFYKNHLHEKLGATLGVDEDGDYMLTSIKSEGMFARCGECIQKGDRLLSLNGELCHTMSKADIVKMIQETHGRLTLVIMNGEEQQSQSQQSQQQLEEDKQDEEDKVLVESTVQIPLTADPETLLIGLSLRETTSRRHGGKPVLKVEAVKKGGLFEDSLLAAGDVIVSINQVACDSREQADQIMRHSVEAARTRSSSFITVMAETTMMNNDIMNPNITTTSDIFAANTSEEDDSDDKSFVRLDDDEEEEGKTEAVTSSGVRVEWTWGGGGFGDSNTSKIVVVQPQQSNINNSGRTSQTSPIQQQQQQQPTKPLSPQGSASKNDGRQTPSPRATTNSLLQQQQSQQNRTSRRSPKHETTTTVPKEEEDNATITTTSSADSVPLQQQQQAPQNTHSGRDINNFPLLDPEVYALLRTKLEPVTAEFHPKDEYGQSHAKETPQLLAYSLQAFDEALAAIPPNKREFAAKAEATCPELLTPELKMIFLRCESFRVKDAVKKYINYWQKRIEIFGDKAYKPLTADSLQDGDEEYYGFNPGVTIQTTNARAARFVFNGRIKTTIAVDSVIRCVWYGSHVELQQSTVNQQKGMLAIQDMKDGESAVFKYNRAVGTSMRGALPIRLSTCLILNAPRAVARAFAAARPLFPQRMRGRFHFLGGDTNEKLVAELEKFKFRKEDLPVNLGGETDFNTYEWFLERKRMGM